MLIKVDSTVILISAVVVLLFSTGVPTVVLFAVVPFRRRGVPVVTRAGCLFVVMFRKGVFVVFIDGSSTVVLFDNCSLVLLKDREEFSVVVGEVVVTFRLPLVLPLEVRITVLVTLLMTGVTPSSPSFVSFHTFLQIIPPSLTISRNLSAVS